VLVQEPPPHRRLVLERRNDRVQHGESMLGLHEHLEAEAGEPLDQALVRRAVACEAGLEPLLLDASQRLVQAEDHVDGRRVVVHALAPEVAADQAQVEIPALHRSSPPLDALERARSERYRCEAGRAGEALLGAGVGRVHLPVVDPDVHPGERGDTVQNHERARAAGGRGDLGNRLRDARRGLGVDERHQVRPVRLDRLD
jgi:hypothetical protein